MSDAIEIPPSAIEVKAWFQNRPSDEIVREISAFVKETNTPYLWRGHTHTNPPNDSQIIYIGKVELPKNKEAPCPCCTPRHGKFRYGRIAWFPQEAVVRIVGHDCFKRINGEGHAKALEAFNLEEKRRKSVSYLLANLGSVPNAVAVVSAAIAVADAVDKFRAELIRRVYMTLNLQQIWNEVRGGELRIINKVSQPYRASDGSTQVREADIPVRYSQFDGWEMLDPSPKERHATALTAIRSKLEGIIVDGSLDTRINAMTDEERTNAAKTFGRALSDARSHFAKIEALRRFLSPVSVATLRTWGAHDNCPCPLFITRDVGKFSIGKIRGVEFSVPVPADFDGVLGQLPRLSEVS